MTLKRIKEAIRENDPNLNEEDPGFQVAVLLIASLKQGYNKRKLAKFTGFDPEFIGRVSERLKRNGVWRAGEVRANWVDEDGAISFWLDVNVGLGYVERMSAYKKKEA